MQPSLFGSYLQYPISRFDAMEVLSSVLAIGVGGEPNLSL